MNNKDPIKYPSLSSLPTYNEATAPPISLIDEDEIENEEIKEYQTQDNYQNKNKFIYADPSKVNLYTNQSNSGIVILLLITIILIIISFNIKNLFISYFILIMAFLLVIPLYAISFATIVFILIFFSKFETYHLIIPILCMLNILYIETFLLEFIYFFAMLFIIYYQMIFNYKKQDVYFIANQIFNVK